MHQRLVLVSGGAKQEQALQSLGALVKPGGWIQVIEATNQLPEGCGPVMHAFVEVMNGVFKFMGADLNMTERMPEWLAGAGFVDIQDRIAPLKLGAANKDPTLAAQGAFSTSTAATGLGKFASSKCIDFLLFQLLRIRCYLMDANVVAQPCPRAQSACQRRN